jgi:hypothetical protein
MDRMIQTSSDPSGCVKASFVCFPPLVSRLKTTEGIAVRKQGGPTILGQQYDKTKTLWCTAGGVISRPIGITPNGIHDECWHCSSCVLNCCVEGAVSLRIPFPMRMTDKQV